MLAALEAAAIPVHDYPSRIVDRTARWFDVGQDGLGDFLHTVDAEAYERSMPTHEVLVGVAEHGLRLALGCALVEEAPCPAEMVVALAAARQQADYQRWGSVDCRLDANVAHPGCWTFADCAVEYAATIAAEDSNFDVWETTSGLGHERGAAGWDTSTPETGDAFDLAAEAHKTCVTERYGEGPDAHKALIIAR